MNIDINELLIINNLINYTYYDPYYIYVNIFNKNNPNNKFYDNSGNLQVKILNDNDNNYNNDNNNDKSYYFLIDSSNSPALAHWICESFICIKLLIELNKKIPNIKILTRNNKKYVKSFLKFFNIKNEIIYNIDNYNNITYLPIILSLHHKHKKPADDIYFNYHLDYYLNYIKNNLINFSPNNKCIFLPRNSIDNFIPNDRVIINTDKIKEIVINNGGIVLDTYHLNNIKYQFSIINNSDIIILDMGSSVYINCLFLENKTIYIINNFGSIDDYMESLPYSGYILKQIFAKNKVTIINSIELSLIENIMKNI